MLGRAAEGRRVGGGGAGRGVVRGHLSQAVVGPEGRAHGRAEAEPVGGHVCRPSRRLAGSEARVGGIRDDGLYLDEFDGPSDIGRLCAGR